MKRFIHLFFLLTITIISWFADYYYPNIFIEKLFYTFLALTLVHFIFKTVFEVTFARKIKDSKTRYSFKKTVSILYIFILLLILLRIWVENTQTLLVSYGIIAAGLAIALQDLFKDFVGGIIIIMTGIYHVGDRIEINTKYGDVIDIGILYTTLLELREWVRGDQPTGRMTIIPNGYVLSYMVNNYTKDNNFIWDEIEIPITYNSDWKKAISVILDIIKSETKTFAEMAEEEIKTLGEKYYFTLNAIEPSIYITLTDNWINFNIRYVMDVKSRRLFRHKISQIILEEIQKSEDIKIATESLDISAFPEIHIKQDNKFLN